MTNTYTITHEPTQYIIDRYYESLYDDYVYGFIDNDKLETEWMRIMMFTNDPTIWC